MEERINHLFGYWLPAPRARLERDFFDPHAHVPVAAHQRAQDATDGRIIDPLAESSRFVHLRKVIPTSLVSLFTDARDELLAHRIGHEPSHGVKTSGNCKRTSSSASSR